MKYTIKNNITKIQRSIAYVLLLCELLTSCGGEAISLGTEDPQVPLQSASSSSSAASAEVLPADAARPVGHIQEVFYRNMAGEAGSIPIDPANTTIAEFLALVKQQVNLRDSVCRLVSGLAAYSEDDTRLLHAILVPEEELTIVKISNAARAQEHLGANYIGEDARYRRKRFTTFSTSFR